MLHVQITWWSVSTILAVHSKTWHFHFQLLCYADDCVYFRCLDTVLCYCVCSSPLLCLHILILCLCIYFCIIHGYKQMFFCIHSIRGATHWISESSKWKKLPVWFVCNCNSNYYCCILNNPLWPVLHLFEKNVKLKYFLKNCFWMQIYNKELSK